MKKSFITSSEQEFQKTAKSIVKNLINTKRIFLLSGALGTGKTTFVKAAAELLKTKEVPTSPTFALMQEYPLAKQRRLYHLDLYRVSSKNELPALELPDILHDEHAIVFIEWPDSFMDHFAHTPHVHIIITQIGEKRHLIIQ